MANSTTATMVVMLSVMVLAGHENVFPVSLSDGQPNLLDHSAHQAA